MQAMQVKKLDHVNIHTANVDRMVEWYDRVLGMKAGNRPPFPFPGAWLYCGGEPTIHLVGVEKQPQTSGLTLEHFAFSATGPQGFPGAPAEAQRALRRAQGAALRRRADQRLGPGRQPHPHRFRGRRDGRRRIQGSRRHRHGAVQAALWHSSHHHADVFALRHSRDVRI